MSNTKSPRPSHKDSSEQRMPRVVQTLLSSWINPAQPVPPRQRIAIGVLITALILGAWYKFKNRPGSPSPAAIQAPAVPAPGSQAPVNDDRKRDSVQASRPASSYGPAYSASAPAMDSKTEMDWSSGRYVVLKSNSSLIRLRSQSTVEIAALKSEITLSRCPSAPNQICAKIQGRQVLVTQSLKEKLPPSAFRRSPWDGPLTATH